MREENAPGEGQVRSVPEFGWSIYLDVVAGTPAGTFQGACKVDDADIAILWLFGQGLEDHYFDCLWERGVFFAQTRGRHMSMLVGKTCRGPLEWANAAEPFIRQNRLRV